MASSASSEMEAKMEVQYLGESSRKEDWKDLFRKCPEAQKIILDRMDMESALACRLVCKDWRNTVNYYKKLWAKINKVFSITLKDNLFLHTKFLLHTLSLKANKSCKR